MVERPGGSELKALSRTVVEIVSAFAVMAAVAGAGLACSAGEIDKSGRPALTLKVRGDVVQACGLGAIPSADLGDLTKPRLTADADFALQCNIPFNMVVTSKNGGLRNIDHPTGLGPYSGLRGYRMTLAVPVQTPDARMVVARYSAQDLMGGKTISSNGGVAFDGAHIHLDLEEPAEPGLAAGDYSETIEISISPSI
jgi:hypothetical protein